MPRRKRAQIAIPFGEPGAADDARTSDREIDRLLDGRLTALSHRRKYRDAPPERRAELRREVYVEELTQFLSDARERLRATSPATSARRALAAYADAIDRVVGRVYSIAQTELRAAGKWRRTGGKSPPGVAVIALGGYGRRDLCPYSDIDIAVIPGAEDDDALDHLVKTIHRLVLAVCQDGCGLEVGWAYRPVAEVGELDQQTHTALLDSRLVVGRRALHEALLDELYDRMDVLAFLQAKQRERNDRLYRSKGSPCRLEPDVKESPGALRDIQTIRWVAAAKFGVSTATAIEQLVERGILSGEDAGALREAEDFYLKLRARLHFHANDRRDVLYLPSQNPLALALGYQPAEGRPPDIALMRDYYERARRVARVCERTVDACLAEREEIAPGFLAARGELQAVSDRTFKEDPANLIRAFRLAQEYSLSIAPELAALIEAHLGLADDALRASPAAAEAFRAILRACRGATDALTAMSELGVLGRYIPEFGAVETLAPRDPSHEYTVGEHSLRALGNLEAVVTTDDPALDQLEDAYEGVEDTELLWLAVLLHDVGKNDAARDHCEAGAEMAEGIARRLSFEPERCALLHDIVRKHLFMARAARLEDVTLPGVIRAFADRIGDVPQLHMLYLLTYADTLAVTPSAWSGVTRQQTEDLYFRALKLLLSGRSDEEVAQQITRVREQAIRRLAASVKVPQSRARVHCEAMPDSYLIHTPVATIARHIAFAEQLPHEGPVIQFEDRAREDFTELTICCRDDPEPGLFAKIAGTLYANDINVHTAQLYTRADDDVAIDVLWIDFRGRHVAEAKRATLARDLRAILTTETALADLLTTKRKSEPEPLQLISLAASNDLSEDHTVIHIVAEDQPGLLYRAAQALANAGLDIHSAQIATWRAKAEDAFYVTESAGGQVAAEALPEVEERLRTLLARK